MFDNISLDARCCPANLKGDVNKNKYSVGPIGMELSSNKQIEHGQFNRRYFQAESSHATKIAVLRP